MFKLSGKTAVITGGGSGIGQAVAVLFGKQEARVVILDVDQEAARGTATTIREAGGDAEAFACDVSDSRQVADVFSRMHAQAGRLDILVNNAGISHIGSVVNTPEEDFERLFRVNVKGVFLCTRAAVPLMLRQGGGVILNMASIAALIGIADRFAYGMTKGAVHAMTLSVAVDYVKQNIRCNCICPARIHTPFVDQYLARNYAGREQEVFRQLSAYQPIGRMGTAQEVAWLALYLCSDEAAFVTGQAYPIDGGVLAS